MKKLENKTFAVIISILTIFILTLLIIFNLSVYYQENKELEEKIAKIALAHEKYNIGSFEINKPLFLDLETYVVSVDNAGVVKKITSYSNEGLKETELVSLINKNISKVNKNTIGNLYLNKYVFYKTLNNVIVVNNTNTRSYLIDNIYKSLGIFMVVEIVIVCISSLLTKWLVKPVEESFTKQKQFISDASHELKTPISIILASAEALEENKDDKWIDNIKSESERMNKLVVDLLDLSKSEDIDHKEVFSEVNLSKIIKNKALSFESLMFEHELILELNIEKDITFKCNQERIKELLSILIDNAIKHGIKNSKIEVSLYKNKDLINLEVKNRGEEIPKEEREKIFERFYRVDKSRNRDENRYGLGLAIAKNIVTSHQGTIYCNSLNGYTTFTASFKQN